MQKICIIGDGLSGLTTANILAKQNIKIDFYCSPTISSKTLKDLRTTAISESNYKYLIDKLEVDMFKLVGYDPHPTIKAPLSN